MKIGLVIAMAEELAYLNEHAAIVAEEKIGRLNCYHYKIHDYDVVAILSGIGKTNAAVATTLLIQTFHVSFIYNVGIAGALSNKLKIGDVVISGGVVHHDVNVTEFGYDKGQVPQMPAKYQSMTSPWLIQFRSNLKIYNTIIGEVCSGDSFVADKVNKQTIKTDFPGVLAVDMESASIAQTCQLFSLAFLAIKGITDTADLLSIQQSETNLELATKNAVSVFIELIKNHTALNV